MPVHEILVTDVTNYGSLYCVAGVAANGTMIRPEPHTANANWEVSRFWTNVDAGPGRFFSVGNVVRFEANDPPDEFPFPHATEDRLVVHGSDRQILEHVAYSDIPERANLSTSASLRAVFNNAVHVPASRKPYVAKDTEGRSLGAVETATANVRFHINNYNPDRPKLRAFLQEGLTTFDLPVTADDVNTGWRQHGIQALTAALGNNNRAHVRLGLSRPFGAQPDNCYVQINGLFLFNE